ncbi:MAG: Gfo/Idh/MocA family oxidoreductase [Anaerolineae bacterium]|nr:Gfo/Idh/MocA family oxidoreductase [Anaerolineae bacterium]MDW8099982.1 Gfo/Idh/MocA family oxidoreductase [Anaerolineae bacterium]
MKAGIVGVRHWHVGEYVRCLQACGAEIVGVADQVLEAAERWAEALGCRAFATPYDLVRATHPDILFAQGPHIEMAGMVQELLKWKVPFLIEKPASLDWRQLADLARRAGGLWAGVDLPLRAMPLIVRLVTWREQGLLGRVNHFHYRLIAGAPERYRRWQVPWMLDPDQAGGGALINFGPHGLDLLLLLWDDEVATVYAQTSRRSYGERVDDNTIICCVGREGALGVVEVSYLNVNDHYERGLLLSTDRLFLTASRLNEATWRWRSQAEEEEPAMSPSENLLETSNPHGEDFFLIFVQVSLQRLQAGQPPVASLWDMAATLRLLNAAQEAAQRGRPVRLPPDWLRRMR